MTEIQTAILAGGLGTRLKTLVSDRPKPMASVLGRPFLEYQLTALKRGGCRRLVMCLSYGARWIQEYFGDGSSRGLEIRYSVEPTPLGTGGALRHAEPLLDEVFQVLNGDTYLELDLSVLVAWHRAAGAAATLALTPVNDPHPYGSVAMNSEGRILSFDEKPAGRGQGHNWISAGLYIFERCLLDYIPSERPVSLERETFPLLLASGERVFGYSTTGYFVDIGTPDNLGRFRRDIEEGRVHVDSK